MTIRAVAFDIGETLLDDTREFGAWADWLGVPRHTFSTVLGAVTAAGRDSAETFRTPAGVDRRDASGEGRRPR